MTTFSGAGREFAFLFSSFRLVQVSILPIYVCNVGTTLDRYNTYTIYISAHILQHVEVWHLTNLSYIARRYYIGKWGRLSTYETNVKHTVENRYTLPYLVRLL